MHLFYLHMHKKTKTLALEIKEKEANFSLLLWTFQQTVEKNVFAKLSVRRQA